jgi:hypothetical protein
LHVAQRDGGEQPGGANVRRSQCGRERSSSVEMRIASDVARAVTSSGLNVPGFWS